VIVTLEFSGGLAIVSVDNPPVNTINAATREQLFAALSDIRARPEVRGVVLLCLGRTFFSGADIAEFAGPPKELEFRRLFAELEGLPVPVVVGMHGTALGGGLELALACHYRVAIPGTRFALPEVTLGIIPGAGGTQRLPRLIGVEQALELILSARPVEVSRALELGFLDAQVEGELRAGTIAYAQALVDSGSGPRRTSERVVDPMSATPAIRERLTAQARSQYPHRSAGLTAIEAVFAAARLPFEQGLEFETELANRSKETI
jgi:3-hydroxyacyl-CoA dehydrogenase